MGLVKETKFISPTLTQKYLRSEYLSDCPNPGEHHYHKPVLENAFFDWLKKNSIYRSRDNTSYLFQGENGVLCAIEPDEEWELLGGKKDNKYQRRVTIRSQPATRELPKELTDTLTCFEFKRVNEFPKRL